jgi:hypothetical protein
MKKALAAETPDTLARRIFDALEAGEVLARGVHDLVQREAYRSKQWERAREALFELLRRATLPDP